MNEYLARQDECFLPAGLLGMVSKEEANSRTLSRNFSCFGYFNEFVKFGWKDMWFEIARSWDGCVRRPQSFELANDCWRFSRKSFPLFLSPELATTKEFPEMTGMMMITYSAAKSPSIVLSPESHPSLSKGIVIYWWEAFSRANHVKDDFHLLRDSSTGLKGMAHFKTANSSIHSKEKDNLCSKFWNSLAGPRLDRPLLFTNNIEAEMLKGCDGNNNFTTDFISLENVFRRLYAVWLPVFREVSFPFVHSLNQ